MGERRGIYKVSVEKPEGKSAFRKPSRRRENNIKIDFSVGGMEAWIGLIWLRIGTGGGHLWMR